MTWLWPLAKLFPQANERTYAKPKNDLYFPKLDLHGCPICLVHLFYITLHKEYSRYMRGSEMRRELQQEI